MWIERRKPEPCTSAVAPSVQFCYKSPIAACSAFSLWKCPDKALVQLPGLVGSYSVESSPLEDVLLCSWSGFPSQKWHVQLLWGCVCSWCAYKQICVGSEEQGKWSAAWGLPGVHTTFVCIRHSSAEPREVQRAGGNGSEREHIQQEEVASGSCSSVDLHIKSLIRYFCWWVEVMKRVVTSHSKLVNGRLSGPPARREYLDWCLQGAQYLWYFAEIVVSPRCSVALCTIKTSTVVRKEERVHVEA